MLLILQACLFYFSPVNLIDSYRNRHGYMLGFGITVTACINVLFGSYDRVIGYGAAQAIQDSPSYLLSKMFWCFVQFE